MIHGEKKNLRVGKRKKRDQDIKGVFKIKETINKIEMYTLAVYPHWHLFYRQKLGISINEFNVLIFLFDYKGFHSKALLESKLILDKSPRRTIKKFKDKGWIEIYRDNHISSKKVYILSSSIQREIRAFFKKVSEGKLPSQNTIERLKLETGRNSYRLYYL